MNDPLNPLDSKGKCYELKTALGHVVLVADMCFFVVAVLDAHLRYQSIFTSDCSELTDLTSIEVCATIGYIARVIFTMVLLAYKVNHLYKFIARTCVFPKVGSIFTPFMSSLLLTVLVYDFEDCSHVSDLISLDIAYGLSSTYSLIALLLFVVLFIVYIIKFARGRPRRKKLITSLFVVLILCGTIGSLVGFLATVELVYRNKVYPFLMFDIYSFLIVLIVFIFGALTRQRNDSAASSVVPEQ